MDEEILITRNFVPSDLPYIMSTWLREAHNEYAGPLSDKLWFDVHRAFIEQMFARKDVEIKILAAADDPREVIGYVVGIPGKMLIWIHIRKTLREQGLAKRLLNLLNLSPDLPSMFLTKLGKLRLKNRAQGRLCRKMLLEQMR